jgi:hypothetical protein
LNDVIRRDEQHPAGEGVPEGYGKPMTLMTLRRFSGAIHMARARTHIYRLKGTKRHKRHPPQRAIEIIGFLHLPAHWPYALRPISLAIGGGARAVRHRGSE